MIVFLFMLGLVHANASEFLKDPGASLEMFRRTQAVLAHYQVPAEEDTQPFISDLQGQQTLPNIQKLLNFMDPNHMLDRLALATPTELDIFQDIDSKQVVDLRAGLVQSDDKTVYRLKENSQATKDLPLKGLRIAIDPGHMGGKMWDGITGKYVRDEKGTVVSEGVIALQVSLLLEQELTKLGAEVLVTRHELKPVTNIDFTTFDILPYAQNELRENIHSTWFRNLLKAGPIGPVLFNAFDQNTQRKMLFSEKWRSNYFILRADLAARSDMMNAFHPDIALVIHFDANKNSPDATSPYATKTYVMGAYSPNEFASRADRKYFVRHLLDQRSWDLSLKLGRSIVGKLHDELKLNLERDGGNGIVMVEPGVLSRNLGVSRRLSAPAVTYLECLYYNRPEEFKALSNTTHPMMIGGQNVPYSDRLVQVMQGIRDGILDFAKAN